MGLGKLEQYTAIFAPLEIPFDCIVFTETWLTEMNKNLCILDNYRPIHLIRPIGGDIDFKEKGGGAGLLPWGGNPPPLFFRT